MLLVTLETTQQKRAHTIKASLPFPYHESILGILLATRVSVNTKIPGVRIFALVEFNVGISS